MQPSAARKPLTRARIDLQMQPSASEQQQRELAAFVRFCVIRIERRLGASERWTVKVDPASVGYQSSVAMHDGTLALESTGVGLDGTLAVWDALCRLERALRDARRAQSMRAPAERFDHG
jgi:hypothetical protein